MTDERPPNALEALDADASFRWQIEVPEFNGPFDLLLQLLQNRQLELSTPSLALIADQFATIVAQAGERIPLAQASEFAAVAAKLLAIKSAALLPRPAGDEAPAAAGRNDEEQADDPTGLTERLRGYRQLREQASLLRQRMSAGLRCYRRPPTNASGDAQPRVRVDAADLLRALETMAGRDRGRLRERRVGRDNLTLARALEIIESRLRDQRQVSFNELASEAVSVRQLVTFFLATLEMCKAGRVNLHQRAAFEEILLRRAGE